MIAEKEFPGRLSTFEVDSHWKSQLPAAAGQRGALVHRRIDVDSTYFGA